MSEIFLKIGQADGKWEILWNYDGSSLSTNIALKEVHLFLQETWLPEVKSVLKKNGVKGHIY